MISNPKNGWCDFELGDFIGHPSDLTDVPVDLINLFIDYYSKGVGIVWFDEEGTEFTLVLTPYSIFIIEEKDKPVLHDFSEMKIENLEKELIEDIEKDFNGWAEFVICDNMYNYLDHEAEIKQKIEILNLIKKRKEIVNSLLLE